MKRFIEVEIEKEEDLPQLENELRAAINHSTHLEGDAEVTGSTKPVETIECPHCNTYINSGEIITHCVLEHDKKPSDQLKALMERGEQ